MPIGDWGAYMNSIHYLRTGEAFGDYIRPPLSASYLLWPFVNILGDIWGMIIWGSLINVVQVLGAYLLSKYFTDKRMALFTAGVVSLEPLMMQQFLAGPSITLGTGLIMLGVWAILDKRLNWLMFVVLTLPLVSIPGVFTAAILFTIAWWQEKDFYVARRIAVSAIVVFPIAFYYIWPLAPWNDRFTSDAQAWVGFKVQDINSMIFISALIQGWLSYKMINNVKDKFIKKIAWVGLLYTPFGIVFIGNEPIDNLISIAGIITMYKVIFVILGIALWKQGVRIKNKVILIIGLMLLIFNTIYIPLWTTGTNHKLTPEFLMEDRIYETRYIADMASYYRKEPMKYYFYPKGTIYYRDAELTEYIPVENEILTIMIETFEREEDINNVLYTFKVVDGKLVPHE